MNIHDARARFTRQRITEEFLKLLKSKPVSKITVTELCEACQINRATFYKHYLDVFDLLEQIETEIITNTESFISFLDHEDYTVLLRILLEQMLESGEKYLVIGSSNGDPKFYERFFRPIFHNTSLKLRKEISSASDQKIEIMTFFLFQGMASTLQYWMSNSNSLSIDDMVRFLQNTGSDLIESWKKENP